MKNVIISVITFASVASATGPIMPNEAQLFLEKMDCSFSAYSIYTGEDASGMLGTLKKGQAYSKAICVTSYEEGGAKKHDYCWLRPVDLKAGIYIGTARYGDSWRDESGPCTKESILNILNRGSIKSQLLYGANKEWRVVTDKRGVAPDFMKFFDGSQIEDKLKKLTYGKYRWNFYYPTHQCMDDPGGADELLKGGVNPYKVNEQSDVRLVLRSGDLEMRYFTSKEHCEKEKSKTKKTPKSNGIE